MSGQLPVVADLDPQESLEGYLERLALANAVPTATVIRQLTTLVPALVVRFARISPHPTLVTAVHRLTGLPPDWIRLASLARYDGGHPLDLTGLDHTAPAGHRAVAARGWLQPRTTQACPECLATDGIWRVSWRLHTTIACPIHRTLLLATCPRCGQRFRDAPNGLLRPHATDLLLCGNPTGGHTTCPQLLTELHAPAATGADLAYQAAYDAAVAQRGTIPVLGRSLRPATYLTALRSLAVLLLHLHRPEPGRRWALAPPTPTDERAAVLAQSHQVLHADCLDNAANQLRPELTRIPTTSEGRADWAADHMSPSPLAAEILDRALHPQRRLAHQLRTAPAEPLLPVAAIPQVMPARLYRAHLGDHLNVTDDVGRAFASLALTAHSTGKGWAKAGAALGYPDGLATRVARAIHHRSDTTTLTPRLLLLAAELDPHVDYRRHEKLIRDLAQQPTWFTEWVLQHRPGTKDTARAHATTWLWTHTAHGHLHTSPAWATPPTADARAAYRQFTASLTTAAAAALAQLADDVPEARPRRRGGPLEYDRVATRWSRWTRGAQGRRPL